MGISKVYEREMKVGIRKTPEFEKKLLATHGVNVGLKCGHACAYCFTPSIIRNHPIFKEIGKSPYDDSYAVVDPTVVRRIRKDAEKIGRYSTVMVCTYTDAWAPEPKKFNLGRGLLETLLEKGNSQVRILTKNVSVKEDYSLIEEYRDRVMVGFSITAQPNKNTMEKIEPNASSNKERVTALIEAHNLGLRTYAMLCPCLPGVCSSKPDLRGLISSVLPAEPEDLWLEPVNARGPALQKTSKVFREQGNHKIAKAIDDIRHRDKWSKYATKLTKDALDCGEDLGISDKIHILLYEKNFKGEDVLALKSEDRGGNIVWL